MILSISITSTAISAASISQRDRDMSGLLQINLQQSLHQRVLLVRRIRKTSGVVLDAAEIINTVSVQGFATDCDCVGPDL